MRNWSCKSILDKKDKYSKKIDVISNRMIELEKDIEAIKMKSISPILSPKTKPTEINSNNNKNEKEERKDNLYFTFHHKKKFLNINNNNNSYKSNNNKTNIMRKTKSCSIIPRDKLEYEYELRILRRKIDSLKEENETLKKKVNNLKEKNDYIEFNINSIRNTFGDNYEENKNDNNVLDEMNTIKYKKKLIDKVIKICKNNINYYNSYENNNNKKESSILNLLLNLMDFRFSYENANLYNSFFNGLEILIQNGNNKKNNKNFYLNNKNRIVNYIHDLVNKEKKLKNINKEFENSKKYYDLCKKFSSVKNLNNYLNGIITKNLKVEQSINKIKKVLKNEHLLKNDNDILMHNSNKKRMMGHYFNRNRRNTNFNFDKMSFYKTDYYEGGYNYNNDKIIRNNDFFKKMMKLNNSSGLKQKKIINTNYNNNNNNYNGSKNKKCLNNMKKSFSVTANNKNPKNNKHLYYNSYSISNNNKF